MAQIESNLSVDIPRKMHGLPNDLAMTPGGTLFGTTPGGTRIVYDRNYLLEFRSSPIAKTPPSNLPFIQGVTKSDVKPQVTQTANKTKRNHFKPKETDKGDLLHTYWKPADNEESQFSMDM